MNGSANTYERFVECIRQGPFFYLDSKFAKEFKRQMNISRSEFFRNMNIGVQNAGDIISLADFQNLCGKLFVFICRKIFLAQQDCFRVAFADSFDLL